MIDFPAAEAVETEVTNAAPFAVLFGHSCSTKAHALHGNITTPFEMIGLSLRLDPFEIGDDVQIAMRRLQIHGLVFHATSKSIASRACATELRTARRLAAPILCVQHDAAVPGELKRRIFVKLPKSGEIEPTDSAALANAMRSRARVHWVLQWLTETGRAVSEREAGVNWLVHQTPQILAEFFDSIIRLHRLGNEDATVSSLLATVLERTSLRHKAADHLARWWMAVEHPLSRETISDILAIWSIPAPLAKDSLMEGRDVHVPHL